MMRLHLLLAEALSLHRAALAAAFAAMQGVQTVGTASNANGLVRKAILLRPDVILVGVDLPPSGGVAACAAIKARWPEARVVILADRPDRLLMQAAISAGADGFATKEQDLPVLIGCIQLVHDSRVHVPTGPLGAALSRRLTARDTRPTLTEREQTVLTLIAEGLDAQRIAERLLIARSTARTHVQTILRKLEVHSRIEAASVAVHLGLVEVQSAR